MGRRLAAAWWGPAGLLPAALAGQAGPPPATWALAAASRPRLLSLGSPGEVGPDCWGGGSGHMRHQGEPSHNHTGVRAAISQHLSCVHEGPSPDLGWLYSLHATELQQQHFLGMHMGEWPAVAAAPAPGTQAAGARCAEVAAAAAQEEGDAGQEVRVEVKVERRLVSSHSQQTKPEPAEVRCARCSPHPPLQGCNHPDLYRCCP